MIHLYVKTHRGTGLQYLGKTVQDPYVYRGSGKIWKHHIRKHGYDVVTDILLSTDDKEEIKKWGIYYSNLWDVVDSPNWANLREEAGDGGAIRFGPHLADSIVKMRKPLSEETKAKMRKPKSIEHQEKLRIQVAVMSAAKIGTHTSIESNKKRSIALKGKSRPRFSAEWKANITRSWEKRREQRRIQHVGT